MRSFRAFTRIMLVVLAVLLALPLVPIASPVEAKQRSRTVTRTFANTALLDLPESESSPVSGSLYPSPIVVSGLKGTIRDVNLTLNNLTHVFPSDVQVLLVGPRGQTAIVMANSGGLEDVDDVSLRLDDEAAEPLPDDAVLQSGTFRPTHVIADPLVFNAPAPNGSANVALSVFDGRNPNGTWRLFVQDVEGSDPGRFAGGWELEITTRVKAKKKR